MKTAIIFNEGDIQYFVLDGDHRELHGAYINDCGTSDEVAQSLSDLFYTTDGQAIHEPVSIKQFAAAIRDGAFLIECGFLP